MKDRKVWFSLIVVILLALAFSKAIDNVGTQSTEDALVRALATYGIARALNGVVSVAQGTEVAIEPAGVGIILTPGQILDPINDLVERFSWVMLVSSASLGVLNVLLSISAWVWLSIMMSVALIAVLFFQWKSPGNRMQLMTRLALVLVILRFAAPMIAIANDVIYHQFLELQYDTAISELEQTTERLGKINNDQHAATIQNPDETSLLEKASVLYKSALQSMRHKVDMEARLERYKLAASNASRYAIDLIVIFTFQTILLPIFFLWMTWQLLKWVFLARTKTAAVSL